LTITVIARAAGEDLNRGVGARPAQARFPRGARLLRHADFERVYKSGRRHFSPSITVFFLSRRAERHQGQTAGRKSASTAAPGLRVGFTVGRALGNAVHRNRMKRRLREAVRLSHPPLAACADVVINPKKSLLTADFDAVLNEVRRAFEVIEQKLDPGNKPAPQERTGSRKPRV
jgi:ribonuclease P protein component